MSWAVEVQQPAEKELMGELKNHLRSRSRPDFKAPFNHIGNVRNVATPEFKSIITPNSDTLYSYIWMDLRAEPIVITMPKIEQRRYYSAQLVDLYTYNFAYLGTRVCGNDGGDFLIAGPDWKGDTPKGVKAVIHCDTQFGMSQFRTQLFNPKDIENVRRIQDGVNGTLGASRATYFHRILLSCNVNRH